MNQGKTKLNNYARFAVDGDLSTASHSDTDAGTGWLKLGFDKTYFISKIIIYNKFYNYWYFPSKWCLKNVNRFMNCLNSDTNVDVSVYQGEVKQKSCGTLQLTYELEQSDQIYTFICNAEGDAVKLSKNTGYLVFYEVVTVGFSLGKY